MTDDQLAAYIAAGFSMAWLPDMSDLIPGKAFMPEVLPGSGNVALQRAGCFVLRVTPHDVDQEREIDALLGATATVVGSSFKQYVFELPVYSLVEGVFGGVGVLEMSRVTDALLAPPSRIWSRTNYIDTLTWEDPANIAPARVPDALVRELIAAGRLPENALDVIAGAE